jgi:hypothetical protein
LLASFSSCKYPILTQTSRPGQTGIEFVNLALAATPPHTITLYVRNPSKVPEEIKSHPNVTIIEGQLNDKEGLEKAVSSGATVFASFAGPTYGSKGTPVTESMKLLFPLLIKKGFTRALVLGTPSFSAPEDKGGFKWRASILLVKLIGGSGYQEFHGLGEFVNSQDAVCSHLHFNLYLDSWVLYNVWPLCIF